MLLFRSILYSAVKGTMMFVFIFVLLIQSTFCEVEYNNLNSDGSFSFRHSNDDIGSYYHSVAGNADNNIRGRYGSRNPSNGRVEETVYTAGPRGFRVNGPQIHRKMDLTQLPRGSKESTGDPLAETRDDGVYSFNIKSNDYNRNEYVDSNGRVRGLYSYFDDIGEQHIVRYAAGAGLGFNVFNGVPDSESSVAYSAPLYKAAQGARGKSAFQRGSNGMYKFIATAPDHRRSEESGPDGIVRGSYSYLDDKGIQRTVEYEAGAGIGYRIIKNSIGRGTHINTRIPNLHGSDLTPKEYLQNSSRKRPNDKNDNNSYDNLRSKHFRKQKQPFTSSSNNDGKTSEDDEKYSNENSNGVMQEHKIRKNKTNRQFSNVNFDDNFDSIPPIVTSNSRILEIGREQDWNSLNIDSTIIKNIGKWYIGLPPGQSVRAHIKNIDILPAGGRT